MTGKISLLQNLKSISDSFENQSIEMRRRPRVSLAAEQFRLSSNGKVFSIADLSAEGMALRVLHHEDLINFPVAMKIEGVLNLKGIKNHIDARVKYVGKERVGCQFEDLSPEAKKVIEVFLDPQVLGRELKPLPSYETGSLWYHGPSGTDLLFWRGIDGKFLRFVFYFHGSSVCWDEDSGVVTGKIQEIDSLSETQGVIGFENLLIQKDARPDQQKLDIAKALVLSSNFPEDMKNWSVRHLELRG